MVDKIILWEENKRVWEEENWIEAKTIKDRDINPKINDLLKMKKDKHFKVIDKVYSLEDENDILNIYVEDISISKRKGWDECENNLERLSFMIETQEGFEEEKEIKLRNIDLKLIIQALELKIMRSNRPLLLSRYIHLRNKFADKIDDENE